MSKLRDSLNRAMNGHVDRAMHVDMRRKKINNQNKNNTHTHTQKKKSTPSSGESVNRGINAKNIRLRHGRECCGMALGTHGLNRRVDAIECGTVQEGKVCVTDGLDGLELGTENENCKLFERVCDLGVPFFTLKILQG